MRHTLDTTSDGPEVCACGASFVHGINLRTVKAAHLAAAARTEEAMANGGSRVPRLPTPKPYYGAVSH